MLQRAYYSATIAKFLQSSEDEIVGVLASKHAFALEIEQRNAWLSQIKILRNELDSRSDGWVFFEFVVPRMGKRADVVLLIDEVVFILEFKVGERRHNSSAVEQALDYALDLKNFHEGSHDRRIVPIAVSTEADPSESALKWYSDGIARPLLSNGSDLDALIGSVLDSINLDDAKYSISMDRWPFSGYRPTPTIVEAAQALYRGHSVREISRSDAGSKNLSATSDCILDIVSKSRQLGQKSICFVTGVPGALMNPLIFRGLIMA